MSTAAKNRTPRPARPQPETAPPPRPKTRGNLALAPEVGQPILTGSRAVSNNAPLIKRLLNIRLDDHVAKLILVTAGAYCNPWAGADGGVCLAANRTLWELAEVGRATFYRKWEFLKGLGLVSVRRRGRTKGGEGMTAETTIRAAPIHPAGFRSAQAEHLQTAQIGFRSAQSGTFRSAQADNPKDLEQGSISLDSTGSMSTNAAASTSARERQQHSPSTSTGPRHACECGHSWPAEFGPRCNSCMKAIGSPPTRQTNRVMEETGRTRYASKLIGDGPGADAERAAAAKWKQAADDDTGTGYDGRIVRRCDCGGFERDAGGGATKCDTCGKGGEA